MSGKREITYERWQRMMRGTALADISRADFEKLGTRKMEEYRSGGGPAPRPVGQEVAYGGVHATGSASTSSGTSPYQDSQTMNSGAVSRERAGSAWTGVSGTIIGQGLNPSAEDRRLLNDDRKHAQIGLPPSPGGDGNGGKGGSTAPAGMTYEEFVAWQKKQNRLEARTARQEAAMAAKQEGQSVYDWARSVFEPIFGPDMTKEVMQAVKGARSDAQALTEIRQTDAYKKRFAGNIARQKAGLPMLSESEYLGLESSYRQSMHAAGLPEGFYDSETDFVEYISKDVSPEEVARRAEIAGDIGIAKNPALYAELKSRGLAKGDVAAYVLDPDKALPLIERKVARAEMGAAARDAGMGFAKGNKFENKLVAKGITTDQAKQAFGQAAEIAPDLNNLANKYQEKGFSEKNVVKQQLGIGGKKTRDEKERGKTLASRERAAWGGQAGSATGAFGNG